jgi:putative PIN family toxin of toxin-antitoxin system
MKVVIDSNILVAAIGKRSKLRPIWNAFIEGHYSFVISEEIIKEYEEIIQQLSAEGASDIVMEIFRESPNVIVQQVYYNWQAIQADADDNKFFDIAVASNADFLVTNDHHFDIVKALSFPKVTIISSEQFLALLDKQ